MPTVKIPPVLRPRTGGESEVAAAGATVGEVLSALAEAHPETRSQLFSEDGQLNRYVNVYLNDEDVRVLGGQRPQHLADVGAGRLDLGLPPGLPA